MRNQWFLTAIVLILSGSLGASASTSQELGIYSPTEDGRMGKGMSVTCKLFPVIRSPGSDSRHQKAPTSSAARIVFEAVGISETFMGALATLGRVYVERDGRRFSELSDATMWSDRPEGVRWETFFGPMVSPTAYHAFVDFADMSGLLSEQEEVVGWLEGCEFVQIKGLRFYSLNLGGE